MLTRSALARDIGVDRVTLWRWEAAGFIPAPIYRNSRRALFTPAAASAVRAFARAAA